ncbi:HD domain-containing protein [Paucilactobacillus nenjiangensis]|uniref:HD domain-containing protein n=1 Tax=Paucilactobacillus nenjiangensis TaxID=1296540 RepID=UPI0010F92EE3|nr:HD domain-containing protein [Paucilactobacillus nenjiangensis]
MNPNQEKQLTLIEEFVTKEMSADTSGHGMDHLNRVTKMINKIGPHEQADMFISLAAGWLHDVIDDKLTNQPEQQQMKVWSFLKLIGATNNQVQAIKNIILNMSFSKSLSGSQSELSIEGQVVQDADRLDAIGALGIGRAFYYSGHMGEEMYNPSVEPRLNLTKEQYRNEPGTTINHFYEKLFLITDRLNTETAKQIGAKRQAIMQDFVKHFKQEWNGD